MLILKKSEGGEAMVPFVEAFVKKVDLEKRQVIITPIEGLL
jgi:ribosomal 30S subunit maturation factor RimM